MNYAQFYASHPSLENHKLIAYNNILKRNFTFKSSNYL